MRRAQESKDINCLTDISFIWIDSIPTLDDDQATAGRKQLRTKSKEICTLHMNSAINSKISVKILSLLYSDLRFSLHYEFVCDTTVALCTLCRLISDSSTCGCDSTSC